MDYQACDLARNEECAPGLIAFHAPWPRIQGPPAALCREIEQGPARQDAGPR